jgi:hypothetical protein
MVVPPRWLPAAVAAGVGLLLWALTDWSWVPVAVALGAALLVRVFGFLLPRALRARVDRIAVLAALAAMLAQSSGWAIAAGVGLAVLPFALVQRGRVRLLAAGVAAALAVVGILGLVVRAGIQKARYAEDMRRASDYSKAQMLPQRPYQAMSQLLNLVSKDSDRACGMFNDAGQAAFAHAWGTTTCPDAVRLARSRITDPRLYREGLTDTAVQVGAPGPAGVEVDGCHLSWTDSRLDELLNGPPDRRPVPGPQMGVITVVPTGQGFGWIGSDFRPCP